VPFSNETRSISYQSDSNDSPVQQYSRDASHFSSGMVDPFSEETEVFFCAFFRRVGEGRIYGVAGNEEWYFGPCIADGRTFAFLIQLILILTANKHCERQA
jgi:hypothetical protein